MEIQLGYQKVEGSKAVDKPFYCTKRDVGEPFDERAGADKV